MKTLGLAVFSAFFATFAPGLSVMNEAQALDIPPGLSDVQTIQFLMPNHDSKTGRTLGGAEVVLWDGTQSHLDAGMQHEISHGNELGWFALTLPAVRNAAGNWSEADVLPGGMHTCFIALLTLGDPLTGRERQTVLAHELYHCYQFQKLGSAAVRVAPKWLIEGGANYVGESTVGGTAAVGEGAWTAYLALRQPFTGRTYDGFGLFFHLEAHGENPWQMMETTLADTGSNNEQRFAHMMGRVDPEAYETWPMSLARQPAWGADWEAQGKDIPPHSNYPAEHTIIMDPTYTLPVSFSEPKHLALELALEVPARLRFNKIVGGIRIEGDGGALIYEAKLGDGDHRDLCFSQYCGCPNGDDALNLIPAHGARRIVFTGVGIDPAAEGQFIVEAAQAHCCPGSTSLDPALVGTWNTQLQPLLDNFMPPDRHPGSSRVATGNQTVTIGRNGAYSKRTGFRLHESWVDMYGDAHSFNYLVEGSVDGCLQTKPFPWPPTGSTKFYVKLTHMTDSTNTRWISVNDFDVHSGSYAGEELATVAWGPRPSVSDPNGDQSSFGEWIGSDAFTIRGSVRTFKK